MLVCFFFFSSRRRHTRLVSDWSSDVCSSDLDLCDLRAYADGGRRGRFGRPTDGPGGTRRARRRRPLQRDRRRRSEERRVGKECRSRWSPDNEKNKEESNTTRGQAHKKKGSRL